ncbi:MAG: septum formation initiator family protein [Thermoanaerobaculia bacterium]
MSVTQPERPSRARAWTRFALALLLLLSAVAVLKSYRDLRQARRSETDLESRIAETEERIATLRARRDLLQEDPATLERLAREELSMVKEGDLVLLLPDVAEQEVPASDEPAGPETEPVSAGDGGR